jgi:hypothetical protein
LGHSGPHVRILLLAVASLDAVFAPIPGLIIGLAVACAMLLFASPRRLLALAASLALTFLVYAFVVRLSGAGVLVAGVATARFGVVFGAALWVSAETPAAQWLLLAPNSRVAVSLASVLAVLPVLERDVEAFRDAARMRGYGRIAAGFRAVPSLFVRAVRRGHLADQAIAQAGFPASTRRPSVSHRWNQADLLTLLAATAALGLVFV